MDIDVAKKCCHRIVLLHYAQRQKKKERIDVLKKL
jgi:hypothetical protein